MDDDATTVQAALALVRQDIPEVGDRPATAEPVRRLDRDGRYVLVLAGEPGGPGWVAAVEVGEDGSASLMTWAANPTGAPTAYPGPGELVWDPRLSRSPLYPLRRVHDADGDRLLDVAGRPPEPGPSRGG